MTHVCVSEIVIIGSDNGLSPGRRQAIIWTNARILLIGPWGTNFSEILIEILTFSFNKMHLKMSSAKWRLFRPGLNVLMLTVSVVKYKNTITYHQFQFPLHTVAKPKHTDRKINTCVSVVMLTNNLWNDAHFDADSTKIMNKYLNWDTIPEATRYFVLVWGKMIPRYRISRSDVYGKLADPNPRCM